MDKDLATAAAMADTSSLEPFEGNDVVRATIKVTNAGDGLSQAMAIDPREYHLGDKVVVVMETVVSRVHYEPVADTNVLARVHTLRAGDATTVDPDLMADTLREQRERIQRAKENAAGIARLPMGDELQAEHEDGKHADERVEGCTDCDAEADAEAAGD